MGHFPAGGGGGGTGTIATLTSPDASITIANPSGPVASLEVNEADFTPAPQNVYFMPAPSGDATGVTDRTNLNAGFTALGGATAGTGTIIFPPAPESAPYYIDNGVTPVTTVGISIIAWGDPSNTTVKCIGPGPGSGLLPFLSFHSIANQVAPGIGPQIGNFKGLTLDLTSATSVTGYTTPTVTVLSSTATAFVATFGSAHGLLMGQTVVFAGFTPAGYNGIWWVDDVISSTQVRFMSSANPGAGTVFGTVTLQAGPIAVEFGDTEWTEMDLNVIGGGQAGSIGIRFNNWGYFCEKTVVNANIRNCGTQVQYVVNSGASSGLGNQSFDYGDHSFTVEVTPNQHGIWIAGGATLYGLKRLALTGNFNGGQGGSNNGSVLRVTGYCTTTHGGTTGSQFQGVGTNAVGGMGMLYIGVEGDTSGTGHQTLTFGGGTSSDINVIQNCFVYAGFASFGSSFTASNYLFGTAGFIGNAYGLCTDSIWGINAAPSGFINQMGSSIFNTGSQTFAIATPTVTAGAVTALPGNSRMSVITVSATTAITMSTTNAVNRQLAEVMILDGGTPQTLTWVNTENSTLNSVPGASPGSTTKATYALFQYNAATTKWACVGNS